MTNTVLEERIAKLCHEANRCLRIAIGEQPGSHWGEMGCKKRKNVIKGIEFIKENPIVSCEDMHASWMITADPTHPNYVHDYEKLSIAQKVKDKLFLLIVNSLLDQ